MNRYADVKEAMAKYTEEGLEAQVTRHWNEIGKQQGRVSTCAPRITQLQAQCYLNRYEDLQTQFGQTKNSWKRAMQHWIDFGFKEKRNANCEGKNISKCADHGQDCVCNGRVYYGRNEGAFTNDKEEPTAFEQMFQWGTDHAPSSRRVGCDTVQFKDVALGYKKQCFCEKDVTLPPFAQAEEGDSQKHFCKGNVFYVPSQDFKAKELLFEQALKDSFAMISERDAADGYRCNNEEFKKDPAQGRRKQCFCDQSNTITKERIQSLKDEAE